MHLSDGALQVRIIGKGLFIKFGQAAFDTRLALFLDLIALAFGTLLVFVGLSLPDAFKGITFENNPALANSVYYLSFVTLTSTGYGDIVPLHPIARSLCNLESVIGQLYPATLLARLVTLELRQATR